MIVEFSIKDSLLKLKEKNYDMNITRTINMLLEKYDEDQIRTLAKKGLRIDNNIIRLFFLDNIGFRCMNEKIEVVGKLPLCNNIEKYMNGLYLDTINKFLDDAI